MKTVHVVMGHEFYSSWPVRAFADRAAAEGYRDRLVTMYAAARETTDADRSRGDAYCEQQAEEWRTDGSPSGVDMVAFVLSAEQRRKSYEFFATQRAQDEVRSSGADPRAGGLELGWDVVEIPLGDEE